MYRLTAQNKMNLQSSTGSTVLNSSSSVLLFVGYEEVFTTATTAGLVVPENIILVLITVLFIKNGKNL